MAKSGDERLKGTIKGDDARRERLAAELRENLKRRKAKARATAAGPPANTAPDTSDDA